MRTIIFTIVGCIAGILIIRGFYLDPIEELGWRMFWEEYHKGSVNWEIVKSSSTYQKCVTGGVIGGFIGLFIGLVIPNRRRDETDNIELSVKLKSLLKTYFSHPSSYILAFIVLFILFLVIVNALSH
jgi:hypothetical protein